MFQSRIMEKLIWPLIILCLFSVYGCKKKNQEPEDNIVTGSINKKIVLIRDVNVLTSSNDSISQHVDSILSGLINVQFISTGQKTFDLNNDNLQDLAFEIIDLNLYNNGHLPAYLDSMAARVIPLTIQILDNSTYGYPDALLGNSVISSDGNWSQNTSVLGTFMNAGQFQGKGERFLGIRFNNNGNYNYGWIKLYCSQHNDTLRIIDFAYNQTVNKEISAGQTE